MSEVPRGGPGESILAAVKRGNFEPYVPTEKNKRDMIWRIFDRFDEE
jgi:hypothetical protein